MSSLSNPASPSSSASSSTAAFPATRPAATFRPHASSENLQATEAGPARDQRSERRRSTVTGSDRKRRMVSMEGDGWPRRTGSESWATEAGPSTRAGRVDSRSLPQRSSQIRPAMMMPGSSFATPIDLSSSPPESHPSSTNNTRRGSWSRAQDNFVEYTRPRWQPDAEVTHCPICMTAFSFWYRKHHCRKCGRVVCAACSPHRITIPRQFIVRDPARSPAAALVPPRAAAAFHSGGDDSVHSPTTLNPALGGGEEVRLCNPCVPDPNPEPPRGFATVQNPGRPRSSYYAPPNSRHRSYHSLSSPTRPSLYNSLPIQTEPLGTRPSRQTVGATDYSTLAGFAGSFAPRFPGMNYAALASPRFTSGSVSSSTRPLPYPPAGGASSLPAIPHAHRAPPARPPHVREQDLCPICDRELPLLGSNGGEDAREAHIRQCIENHGRPGRSSPQSGSPVQSHLAVRLVTFKATEKDCIGHDGGLQECTICMEEYEVGQPLVRLECLCKFHKRCIVEWFERKKECPVHKVS
ncbi:phosphatidylinositol-3-phosphate-binding ubiquitin-protein ligase [Aspergillus homomorphus CBS 101889]|uniref:FYVE-domain-containing protein n=1 Tax=Aspergillus homomorphus (strain CBS 101889) TaxID=1450537 RepID=A0A395HWL8_ASPHC|nr:FYVE-domain-containing protein [Aspergillus homomorphus CBS 101889]RAL11916.1 FYVE-domain-containing protein [Aspergillus homomorphus CBS 101889]